MVPIGPVWAAPIGLGGDTIAQNIYHSLEFTWLRHIYHFDVDASLVIWPPEMSKNCPKIDQTNLP